MKRKQSESDIQADILKYLRDKGHLVWRHNNQPTYDPKINNGHGGYRAQSKWSYPGLPDVMLLHPGDTKQFPAPCLIGLECKTNKGKPSAHQLLMQRRFGLANHEYFIVRSVDDVKKLGL